jgi:hypothetical protein
MPLIEMRPIDRNGLLDAIYSAMGVLIDAGIREDMVGIVAGGLQFLITGEDGEMWSDADINLVVNNEDALAAMLFCDLKDGWQGFPSEEDRQAAWTVCNTIAAAFV